MIETRSKMLCPHCDRQSEDREFCNHCGKILPVPGQESHYQVLGYEKETLSVDLADLENRFFELSKKFHPDRFVNRSSLEMELSHDRSAAVNNAYRTLKNPVARAKYIVERELGSIEEKSEKVPVEMSDLFFEVHESLDLIRESDGNPPEQALKEVRDAEEELIRKVKDLEQQLQGKFVEFDHSRDRSTIEQIKEILSHRSYIKSFLRQINAVTGGEED
jgi:molecular chaperone HscB